MNIYKQMYSLKILFIVSLLRSLKYRIYTYEIQDYCLKLQNKLIIITINGMSRSRDKQDNKCEHSYCPHLHFQRCRKFRQSNIPFTTRPKKDVELTCNIHPKTLSKLKTINNSTLAVQRFTLNPILPDQQDTNFSKNFYLENIPDKFQIKNTMLSDLQQEIQTKNAYFLAVSARKQYEDFAKTRQDHLMNAKQRAYNVFQQHNQKKRLERNSIKEQLKRWITQYFRKVEELIQHILAINKSEQQDPNFKDRLFVKENQGNDSKKLVNTKIRDPMAALGLLQSVKALLLVKKVQLQQVRKDQEHNKSATASELDTLNMSQQSLSGISFISATTNATLRGQGQSHIAQKYCDYEALKKKWGKKNVQQVRDILRFMICRERVNKAEGFQMRQKRQAKQKDMFLRKQMQKILSKKNPVGAKSKVKKGKGKNQNDAYLINQKEEINEQKKQFLSKKLSAQQQTVRQNLIKGGTFDSLGNIYQRHRKQRSQYLVTASYSNIELRNLSLDYPSDKIMRQKKDPKLLGQHFVDLNLSIKSQYLSINEIKVFQIVNKTIKIISQGVLSFVYPLSQILLIFSFNSHIFIQLLQISCSSGLFLGSLTKLIFLNKYLSIFQKLFPCFFTFWSQICVLILEIIGWPLFF